MKSISTLPGLVCRSHVVMLCLCYLEIPLVVPGMLNLVVDLAGVYWNGDNKHNTILSYVLGRPTTLQKATAKACKS